VPDRLMNRWRGAVLASKSGTGAEAGGFPPGA
jgi:hypothetical protein